METSTPTGNNTTHQDAPKGWLLVGIFALALILIGIFMSNSAAHDRAAMPSDREPPRPTVPTQTPAP